jgi:hypothetical protein
LLIRLGKWHCYVSEYFSSINVITASIINLKKVFGNVLFYFFANVHVHNFFLFSFNWSWIEVVLSTKNYKKLFTINFTEHSDYSRQDQSIQKLALSFSLMFLSGSLRLLTIFFPFLTCLFVIHQFISRFTHLKCFLLLVLMFHYPFEFIPTNISDISQAVLLFIRWKLFWLQIPFQKSNKNERNILNFKQQSLINLNFKATFL